MVIGLFSLGFQSKQVDKTLKFNTRVNDKVRHAALLLAACLFSSLLAGAQVEPGEEFGARAQQSPSLMRGDKSLTIDWELQSLAQRLLKGKTGSIVAIDPSNGEILCLATHSPAGEDARLAIARSYPPGSTFKTALALTLLTTGQVDQTSATPCHRGTRAGGMRVKCHRHRSPVTVKDAIAISCNSYFLLNFMAMVNNRVMYPTAEEAIKDFNEYMNSMGIGVLTGIDLAGERPGLLPTIDFCNKQWGKGKWGANHVMYCGIGQGQVMLTPLQLCNLAASIAGKGVWYKPHLHREMPYQPLPVEYVTPQITLCAPAAYNFVREGMRLVMTKGTGAAVSCEVPLMGKTGTAENEGNDHSVFIGIGPSPHPTIAVSVLIEHGGWGADVAAPMGSLIIEQHANGKLCKRSQARASQLEAKTF